VGLQCHRSLFKSTTQLIQYLVRAAGVGANLLLNVGPRPDGTIQPEAAERLREMGRWMDQFGSSIHGTRAGPISPRDWGVTTQRGDTVYVHVLNWRDRQLAIPAWSSRITSARMMGSGDAVSASRDHAGVTLTLPCRR
jgi:alpha-L-fucosidase